MPTAQRRSSRLLLALLLTAVFFTVGSSDIEVASASQDEAQTGRSALRVQVVTGGHPHDPAFYRLFEGYRDIAAVVNPHPSAYRADLRSRVDVLVLYDFVQQINDTERRNLESFLADNKGMLVLHHAISDYNSWDWWHQDVVGARYFLRPEGARPASTTKAQRELQIRRVREHPIFAGVPAALRLTDEAYKGMWFSPDIDVLMTTDHPDNDEPVVWIGPYKKSRVVYIQVGHGPSTYADPGYRRLVYNAMLWCASRPR